MGALVCFCRVERPSLDGLLDLEGERKRLARSTFKHRFGGEGEREREERGEREMDSIDRTCRLLRDHANAGDGDGLFNSL